MLGAILAFTSAALFGLNNATMRRAVINATVLQGMAVTVPVGIPVFLVFAVLMGGFGAMQSWPVATWGWMSLAGVVHFVIGRYGNYRATQALGAALSSPIQQFSIVISVLLAMVFLNETLSPLNFLGIVLIILAPMLALRTRKPSTSDDRDTPSAKRSASADLFKPDHRAGLFWGFVCAVGYGVSPLFVVYGLGASGDFADSVAGVLVSYVAATVVVAILVAMTGGLGHITSMNATSFRWFLLTAIIVALSQLCRYLALAVAPVSLVVPIQRLSVIFRLVFSGLLNRDHEVINKQVVVAVFLSLAGALALTIDI